MSLPYASHKGRSTRGIALAALLAVLAWAQLLWPFLHAHEGPALAGGWHLHTGHPAALMAAPGADPASASGSLPSLQARHAPPAPESAEIGPGIGLPKGRVLQARGAGAAPDAQASGPASGRDKAATRPPWGIPGIADHRNADAGVTPRQPTAGCGQRHCNTAGLPAQPHAPPAITA